MVSGSPASSRDDGAIRARFRGRTLAFVAVCILCVAGAGGYAAHAVWRAKAAQLVITSTPIAHLDAVLAHEKPTNAPTPLPAAAAAPIQSHRGQTHPDEVGGAPSVKRTQGGPALPSSTALAARVPAATATAQETPSGHPYMLFRSTALGETYGRVSLAYLDATDDRRYVSPLQCDRVHFAAGRGLCLEADRGVVTTYRAHIFDREFRILHTFPLGGIPSRARLSRRTVVLRR